MHSTVVATIWKPFGQPAKLDTIPPEVLSRILNMLGPRDVIRLRQVSKLFHELSRDPMIWKTIYENARFPRHPSPTIKRPTKVLERSLVRSEWLEHTWTTQPLKFKRLVEARHWNPLPTSPGTIIHGKWLIVCDSARLFVAYDIHSEVQPKVLWGSPKLGSRIGSWDACTGTSDEGVMVYIVFIVVEDDIRVEPWKLLEFRMSDDLSNFEHTTTFSVPTMPAGALDEFMSLKGGLGQLFYIKGPDLVFNSQTRTFYEFPKFDSHLVKYNDIRFDLDILLTNTHVVQVRSWADRTLFQVFTPPPDSGSANRSTDPGFLCLSHEGLVEDYIPVLAVIRNPTVDPISGTTNIRFLCHLGARIEDNVIDIHCVDITFSEQSPANSMSINKYNIAQVQFDPLDFQCFDRYNHLDFTPCLSPSHDGHVRGLWFMENPQNWSKCTRKFSIDASGDQCIVTVGNVAPFPFVYGLLEAIFMRDICNVWFDGVTGRLCFVDEEEDTDGCVGRVVVVDVQ